MENASRAICGCAFVFNASTPTNIAVKLHEEGGKHKVWLRNGPSMKSKGMFRGFFVKKGKDADKKAELPLVSQFVYIYINRPTNCASN